MTSWEEYILKAAIKALLVIRYMQCWFWRFIGTDYRSKTTSRRSRRWHVIECIYFKSRRQRQSTNLDIPSAGCQTPSFVKNHPTGNSCGTFALLVFAFFYLWADTCPVLFEMLQTSSSQIHLACKHFKCVYVFLHTATITYAHISCWPVLSAHNLGVSVCWQACREEVFRISDHFSRHTALLCTRLCLPEKLLKYHLRL